MHGIHVMTRETQTRHLHDTCMTAKKLSLKAQQSDWSKKYPLGVTNAGLIDVQESHEGYLFQFSVSVNPAPGNFWRTSLVDIAPGFIIVNKTDETLQYRQTNSKLAPTLASNGQIPFHWPNAQLPRTLEFSIDGDGRWSYPMSVDVVTTHQIKMRALDNPEDFKTIGVVIKQVKNVTYIVLGDAAEVPFYRIINKSSKSIRFRQKGQMYTYKVEGGSEKDYYWDDPVAPKLRIEVNLANAAETERPMEISVDKFKKYKPWKGLTMEIAPSGPTKVLIIRDRHARALQAEDIEAKLAETNVMDMRASLAGVAISIVDDKPQEIAYIVLSTIHATVHTSQLQQRVGFTLGALQIDNQLYLTPYSIVMWPVLGDDKPFMELTMIKNATYKSVQYFDYFAFQMQEQDFEVDQVFLLRMLHFAEVLNQYLVKWQGVDYERDLLSGKGLGVPEFALGTDVQSDYMYFEELHINPIKINLSFQTVAATDHSHVSPSALDKVLSYAGTLANIEDCPLLLRGLFLSNPFETQEQLINRIIGHYTTQGLSQLYKIVGSADFLGSPVSLVSNLGTGVKDFFFEPAKGLVKGPKEFGKGLAKGSSSLAKKSIFGIFNTAEKLTKTVARVGETLTFDEDYQRQRAITRKRKAQHVGQGLAYGAMDLGIGLYKGVTGVVMEPIKGGMRGGALGAAKGIGRGIAGLVLKPTIGAIDFVSRTAEGIKNTTKIFDHNVKARVRPPRYITEEGRICLYDFDKSVGQQILHSLQDGAFNTQAYRFHCFCTTNDCVLASTTMLWLLTKNKIGELAWKSEWGVALEHIRNVETKGSHFTVTANDKEYDIKCSTKEIEKFILKKIFSLTNVHMVNEEAKREQVRLEWGNDIFAGEADDEDASQIIARRGKDKRRRMSLTDTDENQPLLSDNNKPDEAGCCACCNIL